MSNESLVSLLDLIQEKGNLTYLSDVRDTRYSLNVRNALDEISLDSYSAHEWSEAVSYITSQPYQSENAQIACDYLIKWLDDCIRQQSR